MSKLSQNKQEKLNDAVGQLPDSFIEESREENLLTSKMQRPHPVLRWILVAVVAIAIVGAMFAASVFGDIAWKKNHSVTDDTQNPGGSVAPVGTGTGTLRPAISSSEPETKTVLGAKILDYFDGYWKNPEKKVQPMTVLLNSAEDVAGIQDYLENYRRGTDLYGVQCNIDQWDVGRYTAEFFETHSAVAVITLEGNTEVEYGGIAVYEDGAIRIRVLRMQTPIRLLGATPYIYLIPMQQKCADAPMKLVMEPILSGSEAIDAYMEPCIVVVNGNRIEAPEATVHLVGKFAMLPVTAVIQELGGSVELQDGAHARITVGGDVFLLDMEAVTLCKEGQTRNILTPAPGTTQGMVSKRAENELYVDSDSMKMIFQAVIPAKCTIDEFSKTVMITADSVAAQ